MPTPETPKEQMDQAMDLAWAAAERCQHLLDDNNYSGADVWAQASVAWSALATAAATRLNA